MIILSLYIDFFTILHPIKMCLLNFMIFLLQRLIYVKALKHENHKHFGGFFTLEKGALESISIFSMYGCAVAVEGATMFYLTKCYLGF